MTWTNRFQSQGDTDYINKLNQLGDAVNSAEVSVAAQVVVAAGHAVTAQTYAVQAAASAASAASVVDQDLSAIDRTFLTSTTLVDVCLYDTAKDSDGGAWRKRCGHTSWENETLSGNWLGSAANEAAARAISGATTNSYYYDTTAAGFYTLNAGSGKTATYRGNARQFPAQVLITAESARVIIWDLTQAGCPMWMVATATSTMTWYGTSNAVTALAALNGLVAVTSAGGGARSLSFAADAMGVMSTSAANGNPVGGISGRHGAGQWAGSSPAIVSNTCNDVAIAVLPSAPMDVATGLPVPTISVATGGGVSIIKDDATVVNSASTSSHSFIAVDKDGSLHYGYTTSNAAIHINQYPEWLTGGFSAARYYGSNDFPLLNTSTGAIASGPRLAIGNLTKGVFLVAENKAAKTSSAVVGDLRAQITKDYTSGFQPGDIRGAWLADTVVETIIGADLVTNGTFGTDTSGWSTTSGYAASIAVSAGELQVTSTVPYGGGIQGFSTVVGKTHVVSAAARRVSGSGTTQISWVGAAGGDLGASAGTTSGTAVPLSITFTATATTSYISLRSTGAGDVSGFDNVTCRLADIDRSVKAKGLQVFGSLSKAAVASGAQLVDYAGWSAANYLQQPYNSDLDFGTGDFCIVGWLYEAPNSAIEYLFNRDSATPGKAIRLWVNVSGYLVFELYDGTTTRTATGTAAVDTSSRLCVLCTYTAGTLTIYVNGVSYATATGAALLTLTNASAVVRMGCDVAGSYPATNAKLALWRTSAYCPSAEQIKHIYETEKALFATGAQCCLAGTSNAVTALAYDEEADLLHVGTSYGRSAFKGLVRTGAEATPVGAIRALAAGAGIVAQAGATGADIYVPAYLLREELLREAEQAAKFGAALVAHDFDATASQTTFTLPVGWEIVAVYAASGAGSATLQREGSGKQWTRSFDGFKWSAVFAAGRSASDWVSILAKRSTTV